MKKFLSILLALVMVCALFAGCASDDAKNSPSAEPSDSAEPSNSAEPSDSAEPSGETHSFGFVVMGDGEFFQAISEALMAGFEEIGWEASYANGHFDPATQIEAIENYAAMGTDVILIHPVSADAVNSAVDGAREAGSKVIMMVNGTQNWDAFMSSDNVATGLANAWMCAQYVEEHWPDAEPGSVPVAIITNNSSIADTEQSEGLRQIERYSDKLYIALEYETDDGSMEAGMTAAENIHTSNPEITLFVTTSNLHATGINNYFAGMSSPISEADYPDYGVWGTNSAEEALNAIKETSEGKGIFRGINIQSGIPETVRTAIDLATGLMDGRYDHQEAPANVYLVTTDNVNDWLANEHVNLRWDFDNSCGIIEE